MNKKIVEFVDKLEKKGRELELIHNIYEDPMIKDNLIKYLDYVYKNKPDIMFIGEAPGKKGCRKTGIPFTSERQLNNHDNDFALGSWERNQKCGDETERTATMFWEIMRQNRMNMLLWNAFPYHPYEDGNEETNRKPNEYELEIGKEFTLELIRIFGINPERIYTIGDKAKGQLAIDDKHSIKHPSYRNKTKFSEGVIRTKKILDKELANTQE